ncbi:MAG: hypothetical protein LBG13_01505 [Holosporales bacterium]|jgi:hypothetical protein|nr:hypothetical protein [Holosporales bacterium]
MEFVVKSVVGVVIAAIVIVVPAVSMDSRLVPGEKYEAKLLECEAKHVLGAFKALGAAPNSEGTEAEAESNLYKLLNGESGVSENYGLKVNDRQSLAGNAVGGARLGDGGLGDNFADAVRASIFANGVSLRITLDNISYSSQDVDVKKNISQKFNQLYVQGRARLIAKGVYDAFLTRSPTNFSPLAGILPSIKKATPTLADYRTEFYGIVGALNYAVCDYTNDSTSFVNNSFAQELRSFMRTELINVSDIATIGKHESDKVALDVQENPTPSKESWDLFYDLLTAIGCGAIDDASDGTIEVTAARAAKEDYSDVKYKLSTIIGAAVKRAILATNNNYTEEVVNNIKSKIAGDGASGGLLNYIPTAAAAE